MVAPLGIFIAPTREFGFLAGSANTTCAPTVSQNLPNLMLKLHL
jgi:hypothetical protein